MSATNEHSNTQPLRSIIVLEKRRLYIGLAIIAILLAVTGYYAFHWEAENRKDYENQIADLKQANDSLKKTSIDAGRMLPLVRDDLERNKASFGRIKTLAAALKAKVKLLMETDSAGNLEVDIASIGVSRANDDLDNGLDDLERRLGEFDGVLARLEEKAKPAPPPVQLAPNKIEQTVYVTNTGKKYHRDGCQYLSRSRIPIKKSEAINQGYTACSRCNP